jgi:hypothetical protein
MIKNVLKRNLRNLPSSWYTIINKSEPQTKTIERPLPFETGIKGEFPKYLKGYEQYYDERFFSWYLKSEYIRNRPFYTITITYHFYDVELNKIGKKYVDRQLKLHERLFKEYQKLSEKN